MRPACAGALRCVEESLQDRSVNLQLSAEDGVAVCHVQKLVLLAGKSAACQWFVFQWFMKDTAMPARGIEDLNSDGGRDVVTSRLIDGHSVALGGRLVRGRFVVLELAFGIDG